MNTKKLILLTLAWLALAQSGLCFYNPQTGRWLSRDPIEEKGGRNLFAFCGNASPNTTDRLGKQTNIPGQGSSAACPPTCGPDVTAHVKDVLGSIKRIFGGWSKADQERACNAITSGAPDPNKPDAPIWLNAWDITELHNQAWINQPPISPPCAMPQDTCGSTVAVDGKCYYGGSVNYLMFGAMMKLCGKSQQEMLVVIDLYKGPLPPIPVLLPDGRPAAANWQPSRDFAKAAFEGWPSGGMLPPSDRPKCKRSCGYKMSEDKRFGFTWAPMGTYEIGGGVGE